MNKKPESVADILNYEAEENPYPEFEDEIFDQYRSQGLTPKDIFTETAGKYERWLADPKYAESKPLADADAVTPTTKTPRIE